MLAVGSQIDWDPTAHSAAAVVFITQLHVEEPDRVSRLITKSEISLDFEKERSISQTPLPSSNHKERKLCT